MNGEDHDHSINDDSCTMSYLALGQISFLSGFVKLEKHFLEVIGYILYPSFLDFAIDSIE